jgi:hypothetical protein
MADNYTEDIQVEVDESNEDESLISYDIATYPSDFTLAGIVEMHQKGDITIPEFQREFVWSIKQASVLIESFLLGLPVPPVFFYIDGENKNLVIDGQQRILSTVFFFEGFFGVESLQGKRQVFRLTGLDEKSPFYRKQFKDLNDTDKRKLRNTVLRAINIRQLAPSNENTSIYHIFERLNTGGTPLKPQEIRNVVFRGQFVTELRELNKNSDWRSILGKQTFDKHQTDVELILRLFALSYYFPDYEKPMKEFLNRAMKRNQDADTREVSTFRELFPKIAKVIVDELGSRPFNLRGRLSTSALDSVFCSLVMNSNSIPEDLHDRFVKLVREPQFEDYTTLGTTDPATVFGRFKMVESFLFG